MTDELENEGFVWVTTTAGDGQLSKKDWLMRDEAEGSHRHKISRCHSHIYTAQQCVHAHVLQASRVVNLVILPLERFAEHQMSCVWLSGNGMWLMVGTVGHPQLPH